MYRPFFSIAIPTYEYGGLGNYFLEQSFDKLQSQTFQNFEVVVSDHSLDSKIEDLCKFWRDVLNIKYIRNTKGRGITSPNINTAMDNCSGEYIKLIFQDDFLYDNYSLEITSNFIKSRHGLKWLMSKFFHSKDGVRMERPMLPVWNDYIWTGNNTMGCPTGMTIKNENIIHFDDDLNWMMDVDYYKKMFDIYGPPDILDEFTVVNRTWGNRLSDTTNSDIIDKETKIMMERYAGQN